MKSLRYLACVVLLARLVDAAHAQPSDVVERDGAWQTSDGRPLYYSILGMLGTEPSEFARFGYQADLDFDDEELDAVAHWERRTAPAETTLQAPWSAREIEGRQQLTYRGQPLYFWTGEWDDPMRVQTQSSWTAARVVGDEALIGNDDASLTSKAHPDPDRAVTLEYPATSRRKSEQGQTGLSLCVRQDGTVSWAEMQSSSGFIRLDLASLKWAYSAQKWIPAMASGKPVGVCGVIFRVNWTLADGTQPKSQ